MIGNPLSTGIGWMLAAVLFSAVAVSPVLGGDKKRARAIEFSDPQSNETTSNTNQVSSKKDGLRQLEEELFQPFQNLAPKSSLDAVMPLPPPRQAAQPMIPNKRAKEMRERMKNWIFMTPEEQVKGLTPEEMFNLPEYEADGQEKKKLSPIEKYYQQLEHRNDGGKSRNGEKDNRLTSSNKKRGSDDNSAGNEDADKDEKAVDSKKSEPVLKSVFDADKNAFAPLATAAAFPDIFGLAKQELSAAEVQKHKVHERELQQTMQQLYDNPFSKLSAAGGDTPTRSLAPVGSLDAFGSPAAPRTGIEVQAGAAAPAFNPSFPDSTSKALGAASSAGLYPQLKIEPPPKLTPVAPSFTAPKRVF